MVFSLFKRLSQTSIRSAEAEAVRLEKAAKQVRQGEQDRKEKRMKQLLLETESREDDLHKSVLFDSDVVAVPEDESFPMLQRAFGIAPVVEEEAEEEDESLPSRTANSSRPLGSTQAIQSDSTSKQSIPRLKRW